MTRRQMFSRLSALVAGGAVAGAASAVRRRWPSGEEVAAARAEAMGLNMIEEERIEAAMQEPQRMARCGPADAGCSGPCGQELPGWPRWSSRNRST